MRNVSESKLKDCSVKPPNRFYWYIINSFWIKISLFFRKGDVFKLLLFLNLKKGHTLLSDKYNVGIVLPLTFFTTNNNKFIDL